MTLATITAPAAGDEPGLHDIINVDLKSREDRITSVRLLRCRVIFEDSHGPEVDV